MANHDEGTDPFNHLDEKDDESKPLQKHYLTAARTRPDTPSFIIIVEMPSNAELKTEFND